MATATKQTDDVIHEYPAIGKYRLRVIKRGQGTPMLDVREYVSAEKFEGFTRRGIRLNSEGELNTLREILQDAVDRGWFE